MVIGSPICFDMFAVDFIFPLGDSRIFKSRLSIADSSVDGKLLSEDTFNSDI